MGLSTPCIASVRPLGDHLGTSCHRNDIPWFSAVRNIVSPWVHGIVAEAGFWAAQPKECRSKKLCDFCGSAVHQLSTHLGYARQGTSTTRSKGASTPATFRAASRERWPGGRYPGETASSRSRTGAGARPPFGLVVLFQLCRQVHRLADDRVLQAGGIAHRTENHGPGGHITHFVRFRQFLQYPNKKRRRPRGGEQAP